MHQGTTLPLLGQFGDILLMIKCSISHYSQSQNRSQKPKPKLKIPTFTTLFQAILNICHMYRFLVGENKTNSQIPDVALDLLPASQQKGLPARKTGVKAPVRYLLLIAKLSPCSMQTTPCSRKIISYCFSLPAPRKKASSLFPQVLS